ncbi:DM13 domain [Trinorchestia longiramus]|nr:DM13 domain [Trinorchestia longiramus]
MTSALKTCFAGAVLVHNSAALESAGRAKDADIYTDTLHFRFTPRTTVRSLSSTKKFPAKGSVGGPVSFSLNFRAFWSQSSPLPPGEEEPVADSSATYRDQRQSVVRPRGTWDPALHSGPQGSRRSEDGRNFAQTEDRELRAARHLKPLAMEFVKEHRPTSRHLDLEQRFRVATIDDVVDKHFGEYDPDTPTGSWIDPLSVGELPARGKKTSIFAEENLALLTELGSGILAQDLDELSQSLPLEVSEPENPNVRNYNAPLRLSFKEYGQIISSDPANPHDALHMRQVGSLCGVFESPLFNGELRALNESAFLLRNLFINSIIRYDELKIVFKGPDLVIPFNLKMKPSDKLFIHKKVMVLDTNRILANLEEVTIEDNLKQLSVSLNISGCLRPSSVWGSKFEGTKKKVSSGPVVLHTANLMVIKDFTYPGTCSAAYFWAGSGKNPENGFKIPTIDGSLSPLRVYQNEDVLLKLPDSATFYDLDYIGIFCKPLRQMLGHHTIRPSLWLDTILPPASTSDDRMIHPRIRH